MSDNKKYCASLFFIDSWARYEYQMLNEELKGLDTKENLSKEDKKRRSAILIRQYSIISLQRSLLG